MDENRINTLYIYVYAKNTIPKEQIFSELEEAVEAACTDLELGELRPLVIMDENRNIVYYYSQIMREWKMRNVYS